MAYFRGFFVPSLSATLNVAWETIKAKWPENSPCLELIQGTGQGHDRHSGYHGCVEDAAEMASLNNDQRSCGNQNHVTITEDSFSYQRNGGKIRTGSVSSGVSDYDKVGAEFGSAGKINEWQAAWNVTNAIQVVCTSHLQIEK